jgi:hypothetical protein
MSENIFEFDDCENTTFKGVLSAEVDNTEMDKQLFTPISMRAPKSYIAEVFGMIWVDKQGEWHMRMRIKFPSGNKQVIGKSYGKEANETLILHDMYKLPMVNKYWFPNPKGTFMALLEIMKKNDLIESSKVIIKQP